MTGSRPLVTRTCVEHPSCCRTRSSCCRGWGPGWGARSGEEAAKLGADLVLASRTQKRLDKMAEVVRSHGRRALVVPTDINDEDACQRLVDAALEEYGRVDCLINNAFAIPPMEPLTTLKHDALRDSLETNAFAPLRLSTLFADALRESKRGSIIMVNSAVLRQSQPEFARLQADQGHAGAPRLLAGHRARPARHPGQLGRAELDLRGRQQGLLRLDGRRSAASPTRTSTARPPT